MNNETSKVVQGKLSIANIGNVVFDEDAQVFAETTVQGTKFKITLDLMNTSVEQILAGFKKDIISDISNKTRLNKNDSETVKAAKMLKLNEYKESGCYYRCEDYGKRVVTQKQDIIAIMAYLNKKYSDSTLSIGEARQYEKLLLEQNFPTAMLETMNIAGHIKD